VLLSSFLNYSLDGKAGCSKSVRWQWVPCSRSFYVLQCVVFNCVFMSKFTISTQWCSGRQQSRHITI